ncbi:stress response protein nst1-like [Anoplophora glabripennis]|uniref:stress response protein nst1-like n=1 Tax=Anoplophora glabripennis TaxID=217634 RepID=UPI0008745FBC|nr:stress response protein nst1-like [Anoplophora glabripennis]
MSKRVPSTSSKGAIPKQPSKSNVSRAQQKGKSKPGTSAATKAKKDVVEWQLPAFSVPMKDKKAINWEKLRKETARRQSPEGEDVKEIRRILKEVKNVDVPVHEFINMVAPYTSDNGVALRSVMAEDLESFRSLAKKVYETMTQDVSDVLVNEQLQMVQYYEEKTSQLSDKMMRAINEIYEMAPNFDFERFLRNKDDYLQELFPPPKEAQTMMSDEAFEMVRRQQAYHRLQWLKSEGERMSEENKRLMRRLEELKKEQQLEQNRASERAAEAETKRQELAQEEIQMKDKLDKLNDSVEKSFIRDELRTTKEHNKAAMEVAKGGPSTGAIRKTRSGAGMKKTRQKKRPEWASSTAADMEEDAIKTTVATETQKAASRTSFKRPKGSKARSPHFSPIKTPPQKQPPRQTSPFHYSPPQEMAAEESVASFGRARARKVAKPPSPFHYSPPKTPPEERGPFTSTQVEEESGLGSFGRARPPPAPRRTSPFHYSPPKSPPPQVQETRIEESSTTVQQKRPQPRFRESKAPRDTWGGFF